MASTIVEAREKARRMRVFHRDDVVAIYKAGAGYEAVGLRENFKAIRDSFMEGL